jgi:LuxR family transcriptional regulator, maltose regulon positive regulatory protein
LVRKASTPSRLDVAPSLPAKLLRPKHARAIHRPRLQRLLTRAAAPVTWVHAPAGAGKTFLLAAYLDARTKPALWYEVDASDRDVSTLFHHVRLAAEHVVGRALPLPVWQPGAPVGLEGFARRFFAQLFGHLPAGTCMAFDNYQEAASEPAWHVVFRELLGARPPHVRLCIGSRQGPPALLSRFRADGTMEVLGFDVLRFDAREVKSLLRGRGAKTDEIDALLQSTRGWAVAVSLLAGALRDQGAARGQRRVALRSAQAMASVFDFLAGEILDRLDAESRAFLLEVALLPHFSATMAATLTGKEGARALLDQLERNQLLLDRHEDGQYRVHDLFRAFLLEHGRLLHAPDERRRLQAKAAHLLAENGYFDVASALLAEAQDWPALVLLIEGKAPELAAHGRLATIAKAIGLVPAEEREGHPWLLFWSAAAGLGRTDDAQALAERAFHEFKAGSEVVGEMLSWALIAQSIVLGGNDFRELERWLRALREVPPGVLPAAIESRVALSELMACGHCGLAYDGDLQTRTERALALVRQHGSIDDKILAATSAALQCCFAGEAARAEDLLGYAKVQLTLSAGEPLPRILFAHATLLISFSARGRFREGARIMSEALALGESEGVMVFELNLLILGANAFLAIGELAPVRKILARMNSSPSPSTRIGRGQVAMVRAWEALERDDFAVARQGLEECFRETEQLGFLFASYQVAFSFLTFASLAGDHAEIRRAIADVERRLRVVPWPVLAAAGALTLVHAKLCLGELDVEEQRTAMRLAFAAGIMGWCFCGQRVVARLVKASSLRGTAPAPVTAASNYSISR